jgi:hypothetical protein
MRGHHRLIGRCDYTEPAPLTEGQRRRVASVQVAPTPGKKTWNSVTGDGVLFGYVSTRFYGPVFRTPEMGDWRGAASDWNRTDPPHGAAILKLLEWIETHPTVSLTPTSQAAP